VVNDDDLSELPEPDARPAAFLDMSDIARGRLEHMGGDLGRVVAVFAQAAGEQLARVATPVALKRGVLRVHCSSASWAQSLTFLEGELLDKLRAACPGVQLRSIRAVVGSAPRTQAAPRIEPPAPLQPLDPPTLQALEQAANAIDDPALRERVLAAARASVQLHRQSDVNPRS
jgi:hypothetical protein